MPEIDLSPDQMNPTFATQNPPLDTDLVTFKTAAGVWVTCTWAQAKAYLKTYNDTLYLVSGGALGTPTSGNLASCTGYSHLNLTNAGKYTHNQIEELIMRTKLLTLWNACETVADWTAYSSTRALYTTIFREGAGGLTVYGSTNGMSVRGVVTSKDLTNRVAFISIYINNATTLAKITSIGFYVISDAGFSNMWGRSIAGSTLHIGWNLVHCVPADGYDSSKIGSPNVAALIGIWLNLYFTGTLSSGDIVFDHLCFNTNPEGYVL